MDYKQRSDFRKTNAWHKWKAKCRLHTSKDYITKEPLCRKWNLHHLDLNIQRYDNITDMNRFMPLNPKTHEIIHELFKWYKKDHKVIDRIKRTLDLMEEYTNESNKSTCKEAGTVCNAAKAGEKSNSQEDR